MLCGWEVNRSLVESNGSLTLGGWLIVTCGLTACTQGSAPGPTLDNEYVKTLLFTFLVVLPTLFPYHPVSMPSKIHAVCVQ